MVPVENAARQGDVMLVRVKQAPSGLVEALRDPIGRIVLAYGELSGHAHAIRDGHVTALRTPDVDEVAYIEVPEGDPVLLRHEYEDGKTADHAPLLLSPGVYRVVRQREYRPKAIVRVVD